MEFNWADPRKNKRVDSVMMAKAEASRVKRLTSVKSTVSNQLNPAVEHKLKSERGALKKKKASDVDARPSSRLHQREFGHDNNNSGSHGHGSSSSGSGNNHSFYNEFLPRAAKPQSVFEAFDVHAAAGGLFHPASNVQAFAEHDARYPSRGNDAERRLPPLSGNSDRSERLASRSDSRLPTASSSTSSSHRSLSGNRSDGDLHAPRRIGIVPSSADRNAMDLLDELDEDGDYGPEDVDADDDEPQVQSPPPEKLKTSKAVATVSSHKQEDSSSSNNNNNNSTSHGDGHASVVPPLALDLSQKFAQLKLLMKTNRAKESRHGDNAPRGPEVEEAETHAKAAAKNDVKGGAMPKGAKLKNPRGDEPKVKKEKGSVSTAAAAAAEKKHGHVDPHASRKPATGGSVHAHTAAAAGVKVKAAKAKSSELKVRNGVSLSDLKEEHRAALAMLQELGGPLEAETDDREVLQKKPLATAAARAPTSAAAVAGKSSGNGITVVPKGAKPAAAAKAASPPPSADRSARLVEKLRSRIPSARDKDGSASASASASAAASGAPSPPPERQGRDLLSAALDAVARVALDSGRAAAAAADRIAARAQETGTRKEEEEEEEEDALLWARYGPEDDGDEDDEEEEEDPSAELYDDECFEG